VIFICEEKVTDCIFESNFMKIVESIEGSSKTAISYISKVERADLVISGEYISRKNIQNWSVNNLEMSRTVRLRVRDVSIYLIPLKILGYEPQVIRDFFR
jgi:hypothetical protein